MTPRATVRGVVPALAVEGVGEILRAPVAIGRKLLQRGEHGVLDRRRDSWPLGASGGGVSVSTLATMAWGLSPVKGGSPVSIS